MKNQKLETAEAKLNELRLLNDEDILTLFATIHLLVSMRNRREGGIFTFHFVWVMLIVLIDGEGEVHGCYQVH